MKFKCIFLFLIICVFASVGCGKLTKTITPDQSPASVITGPPTANQTESPTASPTVNE